MVQREHDLHGSLYILSFAEVTAAKEAHRATEEAEEKRLGKSLTAKAKKDLWDAKVKDVCNTWYNVVFKYATIVNPQLGPEFLATVRKLHNTLAKTEKAKRSVTFCVSVDRVKAFAFAGIHNSLKIELLRAHYSDVTVKNMYHHPVNNDVDKDVRPWLAQWSLWSALELLSCDLIKKFGKQTLPDNMTPEEITSKLEEDVDRVVMAAMSNLWETLKRCVRRSCRMEKNKFETLDEAAMLDEAKLLGPNKDVDGLVVDTTRAKKLKEAAHDEEEWDTTKPKKKTSRGSKARTKQLAGGEKPPRKSSKKGVEEVEEESVPEAGSSQQAPIQEVEPAAVEVEPVVVEVEVEAAEEADEERQRKRPKKRETKVSRFYEGYFRSDIYIPILQTLVVARSSLKHTVDVLQANKSSVQIAKVVLVEELKGLCSRVDAFRTQGYYINRKETNVAVDCLFLDMPSGYKISPGWGEVPIWNKYPEEDDLPKKLMNSGRVIL
ncbi:hypothetical protein R1sor_000200 [Riccia sorocarpa]|uniref:Uncharacterized protein n=1 Tax=Riccia sorocarpa TaxID=122646 RepID=A0ABD3GT91_9MARC